MKVRDFFVHLVEKLSDPLRSMGLDRREASLFLSTYAEAVTSGNVLLPFPASASSAGDGASAEAVRRTLARFMDTLTACVLAVY